MRDKATRIILSILILLIVSVFAIVLLQGLANDDDTVLFGLAFIMAVGGFIAGWLSKK